MSNISRRGILGLVASAWVAAISSNVAFGKSPKSRRKKIPVLHAVEKTVSRSGDIVRPNKAVVSGVFAFDPINQSAMTKAMNSLLLGLP